jgi:N-acetylglucosaminyldiphosphoundecaprenol N-acetyl-beta-D-mannosaminyltransferase
VDQGLADVPRLPCAGVPIATVGPDEAVRLVLALAAHRGNGDRGWDIHLVNAYTLALADGDAAYRGMLQRASLNLPDGTPVVWANRLLHRDADVSRTRVRGPGLFSAVLDQGRRTGVRHFLLGSTPETLALLETRIAERYPGAIVAGSWSPPFRELTDDERVEQRKRLVESQADLVWVGLGTPKQDWECARLRQELALPFLAVGAAFDFEAGTVSAAPEWMQDNGLEWVHRLASEPRRLWKRYLFGNARFVWAATRRSRRIC